MNTNSVLADAPVGVAQDVAAPNLLLIAEYKEALLQWLQTPNGDGGENPRRDRPHGVTGTVYESSSPDLPFLPTYRVCE